MSILTIPPWIAIDIVDSEDRKELKLPRREDRLEFFENWLNYGCPEEMDAKIRIQNYEMFFRIHFASMRKVSSGFEVRKTHPTLPGCSYSVPIDDVEMLCFISNLEVKRL